MQLSYAQNLEDYHLDLLFADQPTGTYIDVGGGHPVADNVSFHFYLKGWRGIVVEPQAPMARLYPPLRPNDQLVTDLVGRAPGEIDFHIVDRLHGLSTTRAHHAEGAARWGAAFKTERRRMTTVADLAAQAGLATVDFLKIDVEGAEADVIAGADLTRFRPKVLVVEATVPGTDIPAWDEFEPLVTAAGYRFVFFDGLNRFYLAEEQMALAERLPRQPTADDVVARLGRFGRAGEDPRHPDHVLAQRLPPESLPTLSAIATEAWAALVAPFAPTLDPHSLESAAIRGRISAHYDGGLIV